MQCREQQSKANTYACFIITEATHVQLMKPANVTHCMTISEDYPICANNGRPRYCSVSPKN